MRTRIYKYILPPPATRAAWSEIRMPAGARVLSAQAQDSIGEIVIWAIVEPTAPEERRLFTIMPTGIDLPPSPGTFVGTVQFGGGALVFHVFDLGPEKRS